MKKRRSTSGAQQIRVSDSDTRSDDRKMKPTRDKPSHLRCRPRALDKTPLVAATEKNRCILFFQTEFARFSEDAGMQERSKDSCSVCLEPFATLAAGRGPDTVERGPQRQNQRRGALLCALPCKHMFHFDCLMKVMTTSIPPATPFNRVTRCPLCRRALLDCMPRCVIQTVYVQRISRLLSQSPLVNALRTMFRISLEDDSI